MFKSHKTIKTDEKSQRKTMLCHEIKMNNAPHEPQWTHSSAGDIPASRSWRPISKLRFQKLWSQTNAIRTTSCATLQVFGYQQNTYNVLCIDWHQEKLDRLEQNHVFFHLFTNHQDWAGKKKHGTLKSNKVNQKWLVFDACVPPQTWQILSCLKQICSRAFHNMPNKTRFRWKSAFPCGEFVAYCHMAVKHAKILASLGFFPNA